MEIENLVRENIRKLQPYSCARDEYKGKQAVFLDANENPYGEEYNRYPDPYQWELKKRISALKAVPLENILLGNGSDEIIDLLIRSFCEPGKENILVFSPGYSMYEVSAAINHVAVRKVCLTAAFRPDWKEMWKQVDQKTKIIFLCTPNNPTGQLIPLAEIRQLCDHFSGLVVVDEAYIDFTDAPSAVCMLTEYPRLVVLQTFSKAWGMAGLRLGMCFADRQLIGLLNKVKAPYNISGLTQKVAVEILNKPDEFHVKRAAILTERERLLKALEKLGIFKKVYASEANFILVIADSCRVIYNYLAAHQVVVRLRDLPPLIAGGIRITVGTKAENDCLLKTLEEYRRLKNDC